METINFNEFYKYFSNVLKSKSNELFESGEIAQELPFKIYCNTGDYLDTVLESYIEDDENKKIIYANIINNGGVQDASIAIKAYVQSISIELLAYEEQRPDIEILMTTIATELKSKLDNIAGATVNVQVSDLPEYSEKLDAQGEEKFVSSMYINVVVFPDAFLSNEYALQINGYEVKYNSLVIERASELTADLQKRDSTKFYPNTTGLTLAFNGLYVDNQVLNDMLMDCARNSAFNQYYNIKLSHKGTDIVNDRFYAKSLKFTFAYGSIVQWDGSFNLGTQL